MALAAREEGDDEATAMWLQRLVAVAKDDRPAWRMLAFAQHRLRRGHEALAAAQQAMALLPKGETDQALGELVARIAMMPLEEARDPLSSPTGAAGVRSGAGAPMVPRPEPPDPMKLIRQKNPNFRN
jgi:hypothetical protein